MIGNTADSNISPQVPQNGSATSKASRTFFRADTNQSKPLIALQVGEALIRRGEPRREVYRIEAGAMLVSIAEADPTSSRLELAQPGDFVGLGFLEHHTTSVFAMTECTVSYYSLQEIDALADRYPEMRQQEADAVSREFDLRKSDCSAEFSHKTSAQKLAAYLLCAARSNSLEGRDPSIISESIRCGFLADALGMDFDSLLRATQELSKHNFLELDAEERVHLKDICRLTAFADGDADQVESSDDQRTVLQ